MWALASLGSISTRSWFAPLNQPHSSKRHSASPSRIESDLHPELLPSRELNKLTLPKTGRQCSQSDALHLGLHLRSFPPVDPPVGTLPQPANISATGLLGALSVANVAMVIVSARRAQTRWATRVIPFFLAGSLGLATYVVVKRICCMSNCFACISIFAALVSTNMSLVLQWISTSLTSNSLAPPSHSLFCTLFSFS